MQLMVLFYYTSLKLPALFFFGFGIPLGLLVADQNQHRRLLYINVIIIPLLNVFQNLFAQYWFLYTLEGLVQVVAIQEKLL